MFQDKVICNSAMLFADYLLQLAKKKYLEGELSSNVHSPELHVHRHDFHGADPALLHGAQEVIEVSEGTARAPDTQPHHVGHVFWFTGAYEKK